MAKKNRRGAAGSGLGKLGESEKESAGTTRKVQVREKRG